MLLVYVTSLTRDLLCLCLNFTGITVRLFISFSHKGRGATGDTSPQTWRDRHWKSVNIIPAIARMGHLGSSQSPATGCPFYATVVSGEAVRSHKFEGLGRGHQSRCYCSLKGP